MLKLEPIRKNRKLTVPKRAYENNLALIIIFASGFTLASLIGLGILGLGLIWKKKRD